MPQETRSYTTIDVARRVGVSLQTVQRWVDAGLLTAWKTPGGHRRIDATSAERLFAQSGARPAPVVVVIDPKPSARDTLVALVLEALPNAQVATAEDGFRGLVEIGRAAPDIVVTDVEMAHMDGIAMLRSLVGTPGSKPRVFVAVTALSKAELDALGPMPDGVLLFRQPPDPNRFIAALQVQAGRQAAPGKAGADGHGPERRLARGRHVPKAD